jgi:hypothetical protein
MMMMMNIAVMAIMNFMMKNPLTKMTYIKL